MKELAIDQIITLHKEIITRDGGDDRIISEANLHQLVFRVNLEENPLNKAALSLYSLVAYPAFREGNACIATTVAAGILQECGYSLDPYCSEALMQLAEGINSFEIDLPETESWFASHARKIP